MISTRTFITVGICLVWPFGVGGCGDGAGSADTWLSSDTLAAAALGTHARYVKMRNAGETPPSDEIPRSCWAEGITALRPLRVYLHRTNIVVVQKATNGLEEGKYIYIVVSSYFPQSGEDGFTFTKQDGCVHDFKRTVRN